MQIGIVKEVFIEEEDFLNAKNIGFIIEVDNKLIKIVEKQKSNNINILKNDKVYVSKKIVDGKEYFNIRKVDDYDEWRISN